jgi:HAD superfamily hydrolase (TIGR01509 family)
MADLKAVLLDVDGTLVDSNDAHARAWVDALSAFGHSVAFERVRELIGKGGDKLLPEVTGLEASSPEGKRISLHRSRHFQQVYLPQLKPFPGARELLARMHADGLRLVVATSAKEEEMAALLRVCGAEPFVQARTSSDDADSSKPDPDIIEAALRKAGAEPEQALMLGDTPYDVEAAARAGVKTIALRSGGWSDAALQGALAVYDDVGDLLARYDDSELVPPGRPPRRAPPGS